MRRLSELEKKFIEYVLELDKEKDLIYLHNVISKFYDKNFEIDFYAYEKNKEKEIANIVSIRCRGEQIIPVNKIIGDFISLSYFIDDLLTEGFLVKEKISDILGHRYINQFEDRSNLFEHKVQSNTVKTKFAEKLQFKFYATELLRELKANNYDTFEKKEIKLTRKIAVGGLIIAIISFLVSTVVVQILKKDTIEIDEKSIEYFIELQNKHNLTDTILNAK